MIKNRKILVTGATGQVAGPLAKALVKNNEVWCAARFSEPQLRKEIESFGIKTCKWSLGSDDFSEVPNDFNHVIHAACNILPIGNDYEAAIAQNAEGSGMLMAHCRTMESFIYISSLCIYKTPEKSSHLCDELASPLGSHPVYAPSYSTGKVASEGAVRAMCRALKIPTLIARLGMAYGTSGHGGAPVMVFRRMLAGETIAVPTRTFYYSLIHEDDLVAHIEPFFKAASVPATIVNWGGDEIVEERVIYDYMAKIAGLSPNFVSDDSAGYEGGGLGHPGRRQAITGPNKVHWKEGILRTLRANFPAHKFKESA
jgi:nucleoside-diphosphate-sugar epimerase